MRLALYLLSALLVCSFGCSDSALNPEEPTTGMQLSARNAQNAPPHLVSMLNWNIYVGADLDSTISALISPDPTDDLPALLHTIAVVQRTAFPERVRAIADVVAAQQPEVIGLQEAWDLDIDLTPLGLPITIDQDFLEILHTELAARGLNYVTAEFVVGTAATPFPGISVVDRDAILVSPDRVNVLSTASQAYSNNIGVVAPGVEIKRGWVSIVGEVGGRELTFVNTHLESGSGALFSGLRAAQAAELMAILGPSAPVILMGDLNEGEGSPMYQIVTAAAFVDVWRAMRPGADGLTCCHEPDLSNHPADFDQRIDFVFARGLGKGQKLWGKVKIVGQTPGYRVAGPSYPIWPSDHAGLQVVLLEPPGLPMAQEFAGN